MGDYDEFKKEDTTCDIVRKQLNEEEENLFYGDEDVCNSVPKKISDVLKGVHEQDWTYSKNHNVDTKLTYNWADDIMLKNTREAEKVIVERVKK